ncbi:MAG: hypothetical protein JRN67_05575, partial [Nitrososphaerota archaeon]|nr:hypothetical protein [Nitrososphaerota archaeon]
MQNVPQNEGEKKCLLCGHVRSSHTANGICLEPICSCTDFNNEYGRVGQREKDFRAGPLTWLAIAGLIALIVILVLVRL